MPSYSTTPYYADPFSRVFVESFNENDIISIPTAFQALWKNGTVRYNESASVVDIDVKRGNEKIAALVKRGTMGGINIGHERAQAGKFTTFTRLFPLALEESPVESENLNFRAFGEAPYSPRSRLERQRDQAKALVDEHIRRILRLNEYLASQAIITGKQPYLIGDATDIIDFKRSSDNTVPASNAWDTENGTVIADLQAGCEQIREVGKTSPNLLILASDSSSAMYQNANFTAAADNRRIEIILSTMGQVPPPELQPLLEGGFQYMGKLKLPGGWNLDVVVSNDVWDDDGTSTPYMPSGYAVLCSTKARYDRYIGPPERLELPSVQEMLQRDIFGVDMSEGMRPANVKGNWAMPQNSFFVDCYPGPTWQYIMIRTQQATIFAPVQTDAFYTLTGLVT